MITRGQQEKPCGNSNILIAVIGACTERPAPYTHTRTYMAGEI